MHSLNPPHPGIINLSLTFPVTGFINGGAELVVSVALVNYLSSQLCETSVKFLGRALTEEKLAMC